ncbi:MAG: hypothetical protein H7256_14515 [Bdellovibrio sp.]|nr:hypothetical protein [Bdellovibrio sp.]
MKSITEFSNAALQKVSAAKAALVAAGKSAEELAAGLGESLKLEGDKLKFAMAAADLIADKKAVRRVVVVSFAEGEVAPAKYQQVEDTHYLVEVLEPAKAPVAAAAPAGKGGRPGQGGGFKKDNKSSAPKSSPWGASPEEIEAKKKASKNAALAAKASAKEAPPAKKK